MPALFTLPKQVPLSSGGTLLPGAKLYFYLTGTTTPQSVYQDFDLTTAHANPVVADSAGVFAPIYLDPSVEAYRVKLTTSADVLVYQLDDSPSSIDAGQHIRIRSAAPYIILEETDALANNKKWKIGVNVQSLNFSLLNDAESVETSVFSLGRSGTTVGELNFLPAGGVTGTVKYKSSEVAAQVTSSFNASVTGFTTSPTVQVTYRKFGYPAASGTSMVMLSIPAFTLTSNATSFTMTGIPSTIAATTGCFQPVFVVNSGSTAAGVASITSGASTTITFGLGTATGGFTNSGSKGLGGSDYINIFYATAA
jgi:hypothetical protein